MELKVQLFGVVYALLIGRNTAWYQSKYRVQLIRVFYGTGREVEYAEILWKF